METAVMIQLVDPGYLLWVVLKMYLTTLFGLIPLGSALIYLICRLIQCTNASEASVLCSLAGCAFYGLVISALFKENNADDGHGSADGYNDSSSSWTNHSKKYRTDPVELPIYMLKVKHGKEEKEYDTNDTKMSMNNSTFELIPILSSTSSSSSSLPKQPVNRTTLIQNHLMNDTQNGGCPICLDEFQDGHYISYGQRCYHTFHATCIQQWTERFMDTCPCCRQELEQ